MAKEKEPTEKDLKAKAFDVTQQLQQLQQQANELQQKYNGIIQKIAKHK